MEKHVPCLCYLCNGKLVTRYIRRKHAKVCYSSSSNQEQPSSDCKHTPAMSRAGEQAADEQHDVISEDNQPSDEQEVC